MKSVTKTTTKKTSSSAKKNKSITKNTFFKQSVVSKSISNKEAVWDLEPLLNGKSTKQIEKKILKIKNSIVKKKNQLKNPTPKTLLEFIELFNLLSIELSSVYAYYDLRSHQNINDQIANAKLDYYNQLSTKISNETMFFDLWFISLPLKKANYFINHPTLKTYKQFLKDLVKAKPHTKSEEIEKILNIKNMTGKSAFAKIYETLTTSFTFIFNKQHITKEELISKVTDKNPQIREDAYKTLFSVYKKNSLSLHEI